MEALEQGSPPKAGFPASLIYKAEIVCVCVCVCVRDTRARFLLRRPQTRCGGWGHQGSGYSGVDSSRLAVGRELSVHFRFFLRGRRPFSNYRSPRLPVFTGFDLLSSYIRICTNNHHYELQQ